MRYGPILAALASVFTAGCGISPLVSRGSNPVIEDRAGLFDDGPVGIIATTADRRAIMFRDVSPSDVRKVGLTTEVCAEPPPDVATNLTSEFAGKISAKVDKIDIGSAEFRNYMQILSQIIFIRSQGVQLYRDGMYNLCVAALNRRVDDAFYQQHSREILMAAKDIVLKELDKADFSRHMAGANRR